MFTRLGLSRPGLSLKTTTYRKIKFINQDSFHSDIQAYSLCDDKQFDTADDSDAYAREYTSTLSALLDWHAPLKTRRTVTRPDVPWYNEAIDNAKRERKKAERKWRKTKAADYLLDFKSKRNHVTYLMNKARGTSTLSLWLKTVQIKGSCLMLRKSFWAWRMNPCLPNNLTRP